MILNKVEHFLCWVFFLCARRPHLGAKNGSTGAHTGGWLTRCRCMDGEICFHWHPAFLSVNCLKPGPGVIQSNIFCQIQVTKSASFSNQQTSLVEVWVGNWTWDAAAEETCHKEGGPFCPRTHVTYHVWCLFVWFVRPWSKRKRAPSARRSFFSMHRNQEVQFQTG